ncbi:hypothetical protein F2P81_019872 [Scophthalmus maximus]|uniref:Uncharacterized protein n=1 Tax=Scophthalmus maximus TaxID=52904 RepID=A0A6A4S7Q6_SCOMX|nr:hypothetical protein F2P81_019872 [Scophthalmus maximus]
MYDCIYKRIYKCIYNTTANICGCFCVSKQGNRISPSPSLSLSLHLTTLSGEERDERGIDNGDCDPGNQLLQCCDGNEDRAYTVAYGSYVHTVGPKSYTVGWSEM